MLTPMGVVALVIGAVAIVVAVAAVIGWRREKAQRRKMARILHENLSERTSLRQAANVLDHMQLGVYVARLDDPKDERTMRLVSANPAASTVTGVRDSDALGRRPEEAFPALAHLDLSGILAQVVRSGVRVTLDNVVTGDTAYAVHAFALPDQGVGLAIEDISERNRVEQRTRHQALHDGLTGLPNRVLLVDRLQEAIDDFGRVRGRGARHRSLQRGERNARASPRRPAARASGAPLVDRRVRVDHGRAGG